MRGLETVVVEAIRAAAAKGLRTVTGHGGGLFFYITTNPESADSARAALEADGLLKLESIGKDRWSGK